MNNIINNISNNIQSIISIVGKATPDNTDPTPGYLYVDLQNETFKSIEKCQDILEQLLIRLKKDSPHIKLKTLKIIKHLIVKGNIIFKQEISTKSELLHQCTCR